MYKFKKNLIDDLVAGKIAIDNTLHGSDNTKLKALLKEAFPHDGAEISGVSKYYCKSPNNQNLWCNYIDCLSGIVKVKLDDFLQEEFVLPEHWCLQLTTENRAAIQAATQISSSCGFYIGQYLFPKNKTSFVSLDDWSWSTKNLYNGIEHTPITFEQFKEHVLKEETKVEFSLPEKWCVKRTTENFKIINDYFNKLYNTNDAYCLSKDYVLSDNNNVRSDSSGYTEITFEQFKEHVVKETKEEFPKDDFGVIVDNHNSKDIVNYLVSKGFTNENGLFGGAFHKAYYCVFRNSKNINHSPSYRTNPTSKTYTLQELKNLDNDIEKDMENKEIIGYKLKPQYNNTTVRENSIFGKNFNFNSFEKTATRYHTVFTKELKDLGVLDVWFEPVYKSTEKTITINNVEITLKKGGLNAEGKDFTIDYIKRIIMYFNECLTTEVWSYQPETVKIGCTTGWTAEHLQTVVSEYNKFNS